MRKLQLSKEISLAEAEENAMKRILKEENDDLKTDSHADRKSLIGTFKEDHHKDKSDKTDGHADRKQLIGTAKEDDRDGDHNGDKFIHQEKGKQPIKMNPYSPPFISKLDPSKIEPSTSAELKPNIKVEQNQEPSSLNKNAIKELIKSQERQTELSAAIANQQRINSLPVQEPPTFSGNVMDYPTFIQAFETIIESKVEASRDRLFFLNKYTTGKANDVVKGFIAMNTGDVYNQAKKLLTQRFGDPYHVAESFKSRLREWPRIRDGDSSGIQELSDFLIRCKEAMKSMKYMNELNSSETLVQVSAKLPSYSGVKWCRYARDRRERTKDVVSFSDLVDFIEMEAELATDPVFSPNALKRERNKESNRDTIAPTYRGRNARRSPSANSFLTSTKPEANQDKSRRPQERCPSCKGNQSLEDCKDYKKRSLQGRITFVRENGLCFGCLKGGHLSRACTTRWKCRTCAKSHPSSLHDDSKDKVEAPKEEGNGNEPKTPEAVSNCANVPDSNVITSMILPVWLHHKDRPQSEVLVYALLDNASDTTFVKSSVLKKLGVEGPEVNLKLYTMHGRTEIPVQKVDGLTIERFDKRVQIELPKAYSRDDIPSRRNQIPRPETASKWSHLQRIEDKIPPYQERSEVGLLIGCNCPRALKPREVITGKADDPYAIRTLLGWGIIGPVAPVREPMDEFEENESTCNRIVTQELGDPTRLHSKFVIKAQAKEILSPFQVKEMLELDFSERNEDEQALSQEDRRFLKIVTEGIHRQEDVHYEMPLPLKDSNLKLPNNREMALRRLKHLKRRLTSDAKYSNDYINFMNTVIQNVYAEEAPAINEEEGNQQVWYIPHHGVYHPKKPNKIRVVFDCSAEFKGDSLNKHLLQRPDMTNRLTGVLSRFRKAKRTLPSCVTSKGCSIK